MQRRPTLHDPTIERGACGIGFVADTAGRASRELFDLVLAGLRGVEHRGAVDGDGATGDGAGRASPHSRSFRTTKKGPGLLES